MVAYSAYNIYNAGFQRAVYLQQHDKNKKNYNYLQRTGTSELHNLKAFNFKKNGKKNFALATWFIFYARQRRIWKLI